MEAAAASAARGSGSAAYLWSLSSADSATRRPMQKRRDLRRGRPRTPSRRAVVGSSGSCASAAATFPDNRHKTRGRRGSRRRPARRPSSRSSRRARTRSPPGLLIVSFWAAPACVVQCPRGTPPSSRRPDRLPSRRRRQAPRSPGGSGNGRRAAAGRRRRRRRGCGRRAAACRRRRAPRSHRSRRAAVAVLQDGSLREALAVPPRSSWFVVV
mmetsp:Transcript_3790/g.11678  ORF Transcript_3790/g.11678 Transcript_3790/m.11678 type:complete len:212 (+) Transcript_3790:336-971(+)